MGCLCSCLHIEEPGEDVQSSNCLIQALSSKVNEAKGCICKLQPKLTLAEFLIKYAAIFGKDQTRCGLDSSNGETHLNPVAASNDTESGTTTSPPTTLTFEANPPQSNSQQARLDGTTHENVGGQLLNDPAQLTGDTVTVVELVTAGENSKEKNSESPITLSQENSKESNIFYLYASLDEEDVCPTCLEEYTFDNPRIVTACKHHYHLGCIYEWMERSETCPICNEAMTFEETS